MKYHKTVYEALAMITQFGITMLVPIFLCSLLGWYLDKRFQTSWLFITFFFMGAMAGFRNIFILSKKIYQTKDNSMEAKRRKGMSAAGDEKKENDKENQQY